MKSFTVRKMAWVILLLCSALAIRASAQTLTTIYNFCSQTNCDDGIYPLGQLVQSSSGNFYGTTYQGGNGDPYAMGVVYKLTPSGALTVLANFTGVNGGGQPYAGVIQGRDGNLYGVTTIGGNTPSGCGAVVKVSPSGGMTVLHAFNGAPHDACQVWGQLLQASDGNFYGASNAGGNGGCGGPLGRLLQASDGYLYGETTIGGAYNYGGIFKVSTSGAFTALHSFNDSDGYEPDGGLIQGSDGDLYGITSAGGTGTYGPYGTVFKITPSGTLTTLYNFCSRSGCIDGRSPYGGLVQGRDGNFYGTTYMGGGTSNAGIVFAITPSGSLSTLYSFCSHANCTDGAYPYAGVTQGSDGNFYGVTKEGGTNCTSSGGCGTAFKLQVSHSTLTVSTSGSGVVTSTDSFINCPGTCSHSYVDNTQVTMTATPATGWAFTGWSGACSGTGSCQVTMTQNTSVSAAFYELPVTLTVSVAGSGSITSTDHFINCPGTCSHIYQPNTPVTLNAAAASGWAFSGWTGACIGVGSCGITMTQNLSLTAVFLQPGHGIQFLSVTPCRLVDTRQNGGQPIHGGTSQDFAVPQLGNCHVPASAAAYSLNVTVVPRGSLGYLTIWPTGEAQPVVSTMNSSDGRIKANAAILPAGINGAVSVYVTDTTDVILDIDGYFVTPASGTLQFYPLTPCRLVDTRGAPGGLGGPPLQAQTPRDLPLRSSSCIPSGLHPLAYSLNFTVVPNPSGQQLGYLTVWPAGDTQPVVSTLNNPTATVVANGAIVPAGNNGDISVYAYNTTDLLIDINGYFAAPGTGGLSLYPAAPCRVLDTRQNHGQPFKDEIPVRVTGSVCAPPASGKAYVFNATVVPPASMLYLSLWPDGAPQPTVSTLNANDGFITSNMAIVPSANGSIDAYAYALTHLILDISGYFAP